jgi:hypothetical protein
MQELPAFFGILLLLTALLFAVISRNLDITIFILFPMRKQGILDFQHPNEQSA